MNVVPVDANLFSAHIVGVVAIDPVTDYDTGEHKTDRDGIPKWRVQVIHQVPGRRRELVDVNFAASTEPSPGEGARPVFTNLQARHWENQNAYGYSSGLSLTADEVSFRTAPNNNRTREEAAA